MISCSKKRLPRFPLNKKEGINIIDRIIAGGYPEAVSRTVPARRKAWFDSYITTILQRDVRDIADIDGLSDMPRLLSLIAIRSPSLLNFAEISRTIAIPQTTLKRYMMPFEATFLIRNLPAWSGHLGKRLVKTSKLIMCDTALMAHLFRSKQGTNCFSRTDRPAAGELCHYGTAEADNMGVKSVRRCFISAHKQDKRWILCWKIRPGGL